MISTDEATVQALRGDIALQVARYTRRLGVTQTAAAKALGVPQPTLSKIMNGRVLDFSMEFLIRIAVRVGLSVTVQTGRAPEEAGAFISGFARHSRAPRSKLASEARESLLDSERRLTPTQRLEAFLEHNQLVSALHQASRDAEKMGMRIAPSGA